MLASLFHLIPDRLKIKIEETYLALLWKYQINYELRSCELNAQLDHMSLQIIHFENYVYYIMNYILRLLEFQFEGHSYRSPKSTCGTWLINSSFSSCSDFRTICIPLYYVFFDVMRDMHLFSHYIFFPDMK